MTHSHVLRLPQTRDTIFYWLAFSVAAFALLPAFSLDYGLLDASRSELLAAYGWSSLNISTVWFALPLVLLFRPLSPKGANIVLATYLMPATPYFAPYSW